LKSLGHYIYNLGLSLGHIYIELFRVFVPKLSLLHRGRQQTWQKLEKLDTKNKKTFWIHCASLGEFEQGRMLIEKVYIHHPDVYIILSFFSSSGYEIAKNYDKVDEIIYLPTDFVSNARQLIQKIKPDIVVFVKYEFWWNLIQEIQEQKIPLYLIAGVFRNENYFFRFPFSHFAKYLSKYDMLYIQNESSASVLADHDITNYHIVGDPRIDRVVNRSYSTIINDDIYEYCKDKTVIIYGSVWPEDMAILSDFINEQTDFVHIIAPHNIGEDHIRKITKSIKRSFDCYSDDELLHDILVIDNIGMLGGLYKTAKYAYVGGGFGVSIHNILEPAVFGIPVLFGPNHTKFKEAYDLIAIGAGFSINTCQELMAVINNYEQDNQKVKHTKQALKEFFVKNEGATEAIYNDIILSSAFNTKKNI